MIKRREFIKSASILLPAFAFNIRPSATFSGQPYPMGLQLYTIRDAMEADVSGTLQKVAELGYRDLETYGFDPQTVKYYGLHASEFKSLLQEHGLTTSSGHYDLFKYVNTPVDELMRYVDKCVEGAKLLGQKYVTWPWLDPADRSIEKFKTLTEKFNKVGERINEAGLQFAYHNHDFEFVDHAGENGYDIILRETDASLVKLQIDLYWVMHSSKLSPEALFAKQPGRYVMWHIKDMHKQSRDYTELGNGSIDYSKILPLATKAGLEFYFIEQGGNFKNTSMESIAESATFFKKNLQKFLSR